MSPFPAPLFERARALVGSLAARGLTLATAESCTGGLIAGLITEVSGSSAVLDRGFVTYSNRAKTELLGVPADLIAAQGAVSAAVAQAMAEGARARSGVALAVSATGVAGPTGGSPEKPVGLVYLGFSGPAGSGSRRLTLEGDRAAIRLATVAAALEWLEQA